MTNVWKIIDNDLFIFLFFLYCSLKWLSHPSAGLPLSMTEVWLWLPPWIMQEKELHSHFSEMLA
jgi:hypothetical protein